MPTGTGHPNVFQFNRTCRVIQKYRLINHLLDKWLPPSIELPRRELCKKTKTGQKLATVAFPSC